MSQYSPTSRNHGLRNKYNHRLSEDSLNDLEPIEINNDTKNNLEQNKNTNNHNRCSKIFKKIKLFLCELSPICKKILFIVLITFIIFLTVFLIPILINVNGLISTTDNTIQDYKKLSDKIDTNIDILYPQIEITIIKLNNILNKINDIIDKYFNITQSAETYTKY